MIFIIFWIYFHPYFANSQICDSHLKQTGFETDCSDQRWTSIPSEEQALRPRVIPVQVEILKLSKNLIARVDSWSLSGLDKLKILDLSWNPLQTIDSVSFQSSPLLSHLNLSFCSLSYISRGLFAHTLSLKELILTGNQIAEITEDDFFYPRALEVLLLDQNRIRVVQPNSFQHLTRLRHLSLADNRLTSLDSSHTDRFRALDLFRIEGNAWHCDCRLHWLKQLTTERQRVSVSFYNGPQTRCTSADLPGSAHAAGVVSRSWDDLTYQQFACIPRNLAHLARTISPTEEKLVSDSIDLKSRLPQRLPHANSAGGGNSSIVSSASTSSESILQLTSAHDGYGVILICQMQDTPKRSPVRWRRDGLDMSTQHSDSVHCPRNSSASPSAWTKPEPSTKWFLCTGLPNATRNYTFSSALVLRHVTAADAGRYTCEYRNTLGVTSHTFRLYSAGVAIGQIGTNGRGDSQSNFIGVGSTSDSDLLLELLLGARARIFLGLLVLLFVVSLVLATVCFVCKLSRSNRRSARGTGSGARDGLFKSDSKNTSSSAETERERAQAPLNGNAGSYTGSTSLSTAAIANHQATPSYALIDTKLDGADGDCALASLSNGGSLLRGSGGSAGTIGVSAGLGAGGQSSDSEVSFTENELASLPLPPPPPPPALEALANAHRADKQVTFDVSGPAPGDSPCPVHGLSPLFRYDLPMQIPNSSPLSWPSPPSPPVIPSASGDIATMRERKRSNPDITQAESSTVSTPLIRSPTCPLHGIHAPSPAPAALFPPTSSIRPQLVQSQALELQRLFPNANSAVHSYAHLSLLAAPITPRFAPSPLTTELQPFRDDQRLVSAPPSERPLSAAMGTSYSGTLVNNKYATLGVVGLGVGSGAGAGAEMSGAQRLRFPSALQPLLEHSLCVPTSSTTSSAPAASAPSASSSATASASAPAASIFTDGNCSSGIRTTRSSPHVKFAASYSAGGSFESGEENSSLVLTPFNSVV